MAVPTTLQLNDQGQQVKNLHGQLNTLGYVIAPEELQSSFFGKVTKAACLHFLTKTKMSTLVLENKDLLEVAAVQAITKSAEAAKSTPPPYGLLYGRVLGYEKVFPQTRVVFLSFMKQETLLPPNAPPVPGTAPSDSLAGPIADRLIKPGPSASASSAQKQLALKTDEDGFYVIYLDAYTLALTIQMNNSVWKDVPVGGRFDLLVGIGVGSTGNEVKTFQRLLYDVGYVIPQEELQNAYFGEATQSAVLHLNPSSNVAQEDLSLQEYQAIKAKAEQVRIPGQERTFLSLVLGKVEQEGQIKKIF